ncbi:hypothetical protein [Euhalothece natronophila]|uniref:hypothetical protein n=1 Tax=Euhalothece natronophila TaxID=577489 RepID=UPI001FE46081|nr:hypothetical protein [Euhalothece natronophila]
MIAQRKLEEKNNKRQKRKNKWIIGFEQLMAFIALFNLGLVFIDITYIPFRNFYLREFRLFVEGLNYIPRSEFIREYTPFLLDAYRQIPRSFLEENPLLAEGYDHVKGIEPHPDTERYLRTVEILQQQVNRTGLESTQSQRILADLRQQSTEMIQQNPFEVANKTATLETIKRRMRDHMRERSSEQAFQEFWTVEHLTDRNYDRQMRFFDNQIAPLIETNYSRQIDPETGEFIDWFWYLDLPFVILFAFEFSVRTYIIHRRHTGLRWIDGMLWRWYDVFLFIPIFRWLRVISVTTRIDQSDLIELESVKRQISQGFVAGIAEDITEVVFVRAINQIQKAIRGGELENVLSQVNNDDYINFNDTDEIAELTKLFINLTVYQVLPKARSDVEAVVQHNFVKVLDTSPAFQGLRQMPGFYRFEDQMTQQIVSLIYQAIYDSILVALEDDPEGEKLMKELSDQLMKILTDEMQNKQTLETMQWLLIDLLEEVKINYVQRLSQEDVDELLDQTRRLREGKKN